MFIIRLTWSRPGYPQFSMNTIDVSNNSFTIMKSRLTLPKPLWSKVQNISICYTPTITERVFSNPKRFILYIYIYKQSEWQDLNSFQKMLQVSKLIVNTFSENAIYIHTHTH